MKISCYRAALLALALTTHLSNASAQEVIEQIEFDGQTITINETDEGTQSIRINEQEIGNAYFAGFDRITEVEGIPVALFYLGDGGNACGPKTLIIWRDDAEEVRSLEYAEDCSTPAPAISDNGIFFVPHLVPGETRTLKRWSPSGGLKTIGKITFSPEAGSNWETLAKNPVSHPLDYFSNEAIYNAVSALTGPDGLKAYADGLRVASEPRKLGSGIRMASGCIPHSCGSADSFLAIDADGQAVYLAQQDGEGHQYWPPIESWPEPARQALELYNKRQ